MSLCSFQRSPEVSKTQKLEGLVVLTEFQSSMGQNLATLLAPEGITVNTVSNSILSMLSS
jgi:hypothetical protein